MLPIQMEPLQKLANWHPAEFGKVISGYSRQNEVAIYEDVTSVIGDYIAFCPKTIKCPSSLFKCYGDKEIDKTNRKWCIVRKIEPIRYYTWNLYLFFVVRWADIGDSFHIGVSGEFYNHNDEELPYDDLPGSVRFGYTSNNKKIEERGNSCIFRYDRVWSNNASIMAFLSKEEMRNIVSFSYFFFLFRFFC